MRGCFAAIVVLVCLVAGCSADDSSTATTTSTASTTSTLPDPGLVWTRVPHDEAVFGGDANQVMMSVTTGGPGLVAAGHDLSGELDAVVWVSADGYSWERVDAAAFGGPTQQGITSVIAGGPGLVAAGYDAWHEAVWTSVDGYAWTSIQIDPLAGAAAGVTYQQRIRSVTLRGPGMVAAGYADRGLSTWTSGDGSHWSRDRGVWLGRGGMDAEFNSVAAGGPGLVAGGMSPGDPFGDDDAVLWVKAEGQGWTEIEDDAVLGGDGNQAINCVAAGGPGLVAVGYSFSADYAGGAVWLSADGYTWNRVAAKSLAGGVLSSVVVTEVGLVAVGWDWSAADNSAAVWVSADGYTWSRVPHDESVFGGVGWQSMSSVTAGGPGLVAVGEDSSGGDADAAVWVADFSLP